jgi:chromosome partitioning protein
LETELHEREAFRSLFSFRQPLSSLNPADVANLDTIGSLTSTYPQP